MATDTGKVGHTPTPWRVVRPRGGTIFTHICSAANYEGNPISCFHPEDAELIVRAVNAHDDMKAALVGMVDNFKPFTTKPVGAPGSAARVEQDTQRAAYEAAIAALSRAEQVKS